MREKRSRNEAYMSVAVPTVDRAFPPNLFWLMIMGTFRFSILSTSGIPKCCNLLRIKLFCVSLICRWASAPIVSKTSDDFPEPETPVKTVILCLGIFNDTFLRLFCLAFVITILSIDYYFKRLDPIF
ncbi:hypothetical protein D3C84_842260 [compost metagenome]